KRDHVARLLWQRVADHVHTIMEQLDACHQALGDDRDRVADLEVQRHRGTGRYRRSCSADPMLGSRGEMAVVVMERDERKRRLTHFETALKWGPSYRRGHRD